MKNKPKPAPVPNPRWQRYAWAVMCIAAKRGRAKRLAAHP